MQRELLPEKPQNLIQLPKKGKQKNQKNQKRRKRSDCPHLTSGAHESKFEPFELSRFDLEVVTNMVECSKWVKI